MRDIYIFFRVVGKSTLRIPSKSFATAGGGVVPKSYRAREGAVRAVAGVGNIPPNESGDIKSARRDIVGKEDDYNSSRAGEGAVRAAATVGNIPLNESDSTSRAGEGADESSPTTISNQNNLIKFGSMIIY